jgi:hypothetical protein
MAASTESAVCRLCHDVLPKKQRRTIFGATFGVYNQLLEILDYIPHPNDGKGLYICSFCWNKLNRLCKIENDIKTKVETLKNDRLLLIKDLRRKHRPTIATPESKKHAIVHSPTPRKVKQLFTEENKPESKTRQQLFSVEEPTCTRQVDSTTSSSSASETKIKDRKKAREKLHIQQFTPSKVKVWRPNFNYRFNLPYYFICTIINITLYKTASFIS